MTPRILIAASDPTAADLLRRSLPPDSCELVEAADGLACLAHLRRAAPDLLVLQPPLLWGSAAGVLAVVRQDPALRHTPVVLLSRRAGDPAPTGEVASAAPRPGSAGEWLLENVRRALEPAPAAAP